MQLQIIMNRVQAGVSWQMPLEEGPPKNGFSDCDTEKQSL